MAARDNAYLELLKKCLTGSLYEESAWRLKRANNQRGGFSGWLRSVFYRCLERRSLALLKRKPLDLAAREEGLDWPWLALTMVGHRRLDNLQHCIERILENNIPGDLCETGVWRGGASIFMRAVLKCHGVTDRRVWVADSFQGMPKPRAAVDLSDPKYDLSDSEYLAASLDAVKKNFERFDLLDDQVEFLEGWFRDTLPDAPIEKLALLRLDGDLYESTLDALNALYHRVSPGGYVIVDDYNAMPPCKQAVTEFLSNTELDVAIEPIDRYGIYWQVPR